jgi:hypothetical protein
MNAQPSTRRSYSWRWIALLWLGLALVNGGPGVVVGPPGRVVAVVGFSVVGGLIREIDIIGDRAKLQGMQGA